jgi:RNA polymerase sigma-70 factor (ECF subfamily)
VRFERADAAPRGGPVIVSGVSSSEEAELVALARAGDVAAFERLIAPHERRLFALARHLVGAEDAADALQSGLLSAIESFVGFRGESAFGTWLTRVVTNAALKLLRTGRSRPAVSIEALADDAEIPRPEFVADWRDDPRKLVEQRELRHVLDEAIAALPDIHRVVFVLRDVAGLNVAETAKALEISEANVKVRLLRARLALREKLTRKFGDESRRVEVPRDGHEHPHRKEAAP